MPNNWYVITGGPSTGKTTLLNELKKLGHQTVGEVARAVIDEGISRGLSAKEIRADERSFQEKVLRLKLDTEAKLHHGKLTFLDRGMHDTVAYLEAIGEEVSDELRTLVNKSKYRKVFLLEPLGVYAKDYARTEDKATIERLTQLLYNAYHKAGMEVMKVPPGDVKQRLGFVLDNL